MDYTQNLHLPQWEESDRIMRTDFNDAMASIDAGVKAATDAAAAAPRIVTGTYVGDGEATRVIPLGVTPKFVSVWKDFSYQGDDNVIFGGVAITGAAGNPVRITNGGFEVYYNEYMPARRTNCYDITYAYLALY